MARYQPRIDVHQLSSEERAALQPGQHITAGPNNNGIWLGQKSNGVDVAAWEGNMKGISGATRRNYIALKRRYARM